MPWEKSLISGAIALLHGCPGQQSEPSWLDYSTMFAICSLCFYVGIDQGTISAMATASADLRATQKYKKKSK
jgi:hypothetical protein